MILLGLSWIVEVLGEKAAGEGKVGLSALDKVVQEPNAPRVFEQGRGWGLVYGKGGGFGWKGGVIGRQSIIP